MQRLVSPSIPHIYALFPFLWPDIRCPIELLSHHQTSSAHNSNLSHPGDRIIVVVQKQRNFGPESGGGGVSVSAANKVRRGDIRHAVVVRTKKQYQRPDGSVVKFDDNACVLINKGGEPIGTRLNGKLTLFIHKTHERTRGLTLPHTGLVGKELRNMQWSKILSLAPMHL